MGLGPVEQRHVWISGVVQGVFFRQATRRRAQELGLTGWVRNLPDGRVEAVFRGSTEAVQAILEWCHEGPPSATVERVETLTETSGAPFPGFGIR
jgi:acylphosphatase